MDLSNINILIDGYNLLLKDGTGIKTYASTLAKSLRLLGANIYLLSDSPNPPSRDPILSEVLLFDDKDEKTKSNFLLRFVRSLLYSKARFLERQNVVVDKELDYVAGNLNSQDCYSIARAKKRILGLTYKIVPSKKIHVWHATYPIPISIKGAKKITTIHDLIPLKLPYTTLDDKKLYFRVVRDSLKESAMIIVPSENTKKDILNIFDFDPLKIFVTYESVDIRFIPSNPELISPSLNKRFRLTFKKYILFVGAIEPKKNIGRLIDAYSLIDTDMPLVIVGKKAWLWEKEIGKLEAIFGKSFPKRVRLLEHVSKDELSYLYAGAYCLVFPSLYEGFGLPALEAMTAGCPVITSNISSLPEVCGNAALYVDPYDVNDIRNKIEQLIAKPDLREELSALGKKRAEIFSMDKYSKRVYESYRSIL